MFVTCIADTQTNIRYTIAQNDAPLGAGATAKVWKGLDAQNPSHPPVAIKIAHRGTPAALLEEFWGELELLKVLAETEARESVPWAHKGYAPEEPGAAIIVMELIPDAWQLVRWAQGSGRRLGEDLALATGLQYARLLVALHALRRTTCGDRKAADLRWDAAHKRLVVLDWNRARAIPNGAMASAREELVRQDLHGFGQLWSELLLGRRATALPQVDETDDPSWAALSRGTRVILGRALGSRASWGYGTAEELAGDLAEHAQRLGQPTSELLRQAESACRKAQQLVSSQEGVGLADRVLTLVDLATRAQTGVSSDRLRLEALRAWAQQQVSATEQEIAEAILRIKRETLLQAYDRAMTIAQEARNRLGNPKKRESSGILRLARWQAISQAGVRGNELGRDMGRSVRALQECAARLEEAAMGSELALQNARAVLERTEQAGPVEYGTLFAPLRLEIEIRGSLVQASEQGGVQRGAGAGDSYRQATQAWKRLAAVDTFYAMALRAELTGLDKKLAADALEDDLVPDLEEKRDSLRRVVDELLAELQNGQGLWRDLANKLGIARECYRAFSALLPGPDEDGRARYEFVSWLADINDCMSRNDIACALARAQAMPVPPIPEEHKMVTVCRCQNAALAFAHLLINDGSWPDEFQRAHEVVNIVKRSGALSDEGQRDVEDLESQLAAVKGHLAALRNRLAALVGDYAEVLDAPENIAVDEVLREAQREHYEIMNRAGLTTEEATACSVESLLTRRCAARLLGQARALEQQLDQAGINLQEKTQLLKQAQALQEQIVAARQSIGSEQGQKVSGQM